MKTITGKVIQVEIGVPVKKKDGGTYDGWRLTYQTDDGSIEGIAKAMSGLKYQPSLRTALEGLTAGDIATVEMEKNDKGFWDVMSIGKGGKVPSDIPKKEYKTDKSSTYETKEERAARQVMIVRQSSLSNAISSFGVKIVDATAKAVLARAEQFESWVFRKEPESQTTAEVD